jgi:outer membrane immunogenic protein
MRYRLIALLAATAMAGVSVQASAADLPARMPVKAPAYVAAFTWTGFYFGGHIGGGWSRTDLSDPTAVGFAAPGASFSNNNSAFLGGVQAGYNWQAGNWVFGIQGDGTWTGINASSSTPLIPAVIMNDKVDWLATATGRLGYAWGATLLYGKGGAAWVNNKYSAVGGGANTSATQTRTGWTAGGGLEYGFSRNWSGFVEYDYIGLGSNTVTLTGTGGPIPVGVKQNLSLVKAGINYRFGGL